MSCLQTSVWTSFQILFKDVFAALSPGWSSYSFRASFKGFLMIFSKSPEYPRMAPTNITMKRARMMVKYVPNIHLLSFHAPQQPKKEMRTTKAEITTMMYPADVYKEMSAASNPSHPSSQASIA